MPTLISPEGQFEILVRSTEYFARKYLLGQVCARPEVGSE